MAAANRKNTPAMAKKRQEPEDQRLRLVAAEEAQADDGADEHRREQQHEPHMARAVRPVDRRARRRIAVLSHETS